MAFLRIVVPLAAVLVTSIVFAGVTRRVGVGRPYDNIQSAIEASVSGDRVLVYPGVYVVYPGTPRTLITYGGRNIIVESLDPHDPNVVASTIIQLAPITNYQTRYSIVAIVNGETRGAVFRGFTVRKGRDPYYGAGIRVAGGARPTIEHCVFVDNDCTGGPGGAIFLGGPALVQECRFENNRAASYLGFAEGGGAISTKEAGRPTIRNNLFLNNRSSSGGGAVKVGESPADIYDNTFDGNEAPEGSGVEAVGEGARIYNNVFVRNRATVNGGTIYVRRACEVYNNIIRRNEAAHGAGVGLSEGAAQLHHNVICDNVSDYFSGHNGGGVFIDFAANGSVIENNTIAYNQALASPGWAKGANLFMRGATVTIRNNIIAFGNEGGGIYVFSGTPTFSRNCVFGNGGGNYANFPDPTGKSGNISVDPLFVRPPTGDYHLSSRQGHYTPAGWVADPVHSPCIDAGPPLGAGALEPAPNGGLRNLGAFGGTEQASKSFGAPAPKPDMQIRGPQVNAVWIGDDIYSATGKNQRVQRVLKPGQTSVYGLMVENDESGSDTFIVFGAPSPHANVQVDYFDAQTGGANITAAVTGLGWKTRSLGAGQAHTFRVVVKALAGAPVGASFNLPVWAASVSDPDYQRDMVKAGVNLVAATASAQIAALRALPTGVGAEVSFALAGDARVTAVVRNLAGRPVRTLCRERDCMAGPNTLLWDGRSDTGLAVPGGTYLVEVAALEAGGAECRALAALRLSR